MLSLLGGILGVAAHFSYAGLFALVVLGVLGFPFPEDLILIASGALVAGGSLRLLPAAAVLYAALLLGDLLIYAAGRKYGRAIVDHRLFRRVVSPRRLASLEERVRRHGVWLILVGRHLLVLRAQIFLAAGVMRMRPRTFFVADALSSAVTMAVMLSIGYAGHRGLAAVVRDVRMVERGLLAAALAAAAAYLAVLLVRSRRKASPGGAAR